MSNITKSIYGIFQVSFETQLQLILENLKQHEGDIDTLITKSAEIENATDLEQLLKQLRQRVVLLITRASHGTTLITVKFAKQINYNFKFFGFNHKNYF